MARTVVAPQAAGPAGSKLDYTAPTVDGDSVPPGCRVIVRNSSAAPITVTVQTGGTAAGGYAIADVGPTSIPAGEDWIFGPFTPRETFVQPAGADAGRVLVDYSAVASVTRAAVAA